MLTKEKIKKKQSKINKQKTAKKNIYTRVG